MVGSALVPLGLRLSPFLVLQSGSPYDVLLGRDLNGDTLTNDRPAFASGPGPGIVATELGDFLINPAPGTPLVPRNYLTAAGMASVNVRVSRTFGFGLPRSGAGNMGGGRGFGGRRGEGGGAMRMSPGGPGPMGMGSLNEHRYNITLSVMCANVLNHVNPGGYTGILTSPQFGQPSSVNTGFGGGRGGFGSTANNRRVEMSLRFNF
jgi:hypothetical protein